MAEEFNPFRTPASSRTAVLIIEAARAIVVEEGPQAVTRRRVAERAGLKPSEVSRVFHNRAALMRALASS